MTPLPVAVIVLVLLCVLASACAGLGTLYAMQARRLGRAGAYTAARSSRHTAAVFALLLAAYVALAVYVKAGLAGSS